MARPTRVLAGAIVLCLPMAPGVMSGDIPTDTALERLLIALVVSWVGSTIIGNVWNGYARSLQRQELLAEIEKVTGQPLHPEAQGPQALDTARPDQIIPPP